MSAFRVLSFNSDILKSAAPLTFDAYKIKCTSCIVSNVGDVTAVQSTAVESILVANDW